MKSFACTYFYSEICKYLYQKYISLHSPPEQDKMLLRAKCMCSILGGSGKEIPHAMSSIYITAI